MYEVDDDTYCYPGTTVLKNLLDLKDQKELDAFEAEITAQRASEPLPKGDLDDAHYKAIHHHFFQDEYDWAGKPRSVRISKGGNAFCFPEHIDTQMKKLFDSLAGKKASVRAYEGPVRQRGGALLGRDQRHPPVPGRQWPCATVLLDVTG